MCLCGGLTLELVRQKAYDVLILDCALPVGNGLDLRGAIAIGQPVGSKVPAIIELRDAHESARRERRREADGVLSVVTKPVQMKKLLRLTQKIIKLQQLRPWPTTVVPETESASVATAGGL